VPNYINNNTQFDLMNEKFYLMLASGPVFSANTIGNHGSLLNARGITNDAIDLRKPQIVETTTPDGTTVDDNTSSIYEGCGETKVCFSLPDMCYKNADVECNQFGAVTYEESGNFTFEILGLPNRSYASIALSFDQRMEDDSNIECVNFNNQLSAYISWLIRTPLPGNDRTVVVSLL
jgi:hypothetical protein